jgi:hypothetical protein
MHVAGQSSEVVSLTRVAVPVTLAALVRSTAEDVRQTKESVSQAGMQGCWFSSAVDSYA